MERIFTFLRNDQLAVNDPIKQSLWSEYAPYLGEQDSPDLQRSELRCELVGYDTQETPNPGSYSLNVVQHFRKEGKESQIDEFNRFKASRQQEVCKLLVDA